MIWDTWVIVGFIAQSLFTLRFGIQWIASEKRKKSHIPEAFWYFSLAGGTLLLLYSIHRKDPVYIVGQATGLLIYVRNIYFIIQQKRVLFRTTLPQSESQKIDSF
jgi:lipid-A-disaccharide synthase-like uncharacterized protein